MSNKTGEGSQQELTVDQRQFHLEEFKNLRIEDLEYTKKYDQLKLIVPTAIGAVYSMVLGLHR